MWLSGLSYHVNSYYLLLFARLSSGVAEASFFVVAPPLIESRAGTTAGLWMSIFLGAIPLGMSTGLFFGEVVSHHYHWSLCFHVMACATLPIVISLFFIHDNVNGGVLAPSTHTVPSRDGTGEDRKVHFTFKDEVLACMKSGKLMSIILANSIICGK